MSHFRGSLGRHVLSRVLLLILTYGILFVICPVLFVLDVHRKSTQATERIRRRKERRWNGDNVERIRDVMICLIIWQIQLKQTVFQAVTVDFRVTHEPFDSIHWLKTQFIFLSWSLVTLYKEKTQDTCLVNMNFRQLGFAFFFWQNSLNFTQFLHFLCKDTTSTAFGTKQI